MHQRARDRLPKLPMLVDAVDQHRADQHVLLTAASGTAIGETFTQSPSQIPPRRIQWLHRHLPEERRGSAGDH